MQATKRTPARQAARKLLQALENLRAENDAAFWPTSKVLEASGLSMSARGQNLKVLTRLYENGLVQRVGRGQFSWKLKGAYDPNADIDLKGMDGGSDSDSDGDKPLPSPSTCKCGGTGKWVNPKNAADVRPCFYCQGDKARGGNGLIDTQTIKELRGAIESLVEGMGDLRKRNEELEELVKNAKRANIDITIRKPDGTKIKKLKNKALPAVYEDVVTLAQARCNILLVGPAGCGKTYLGKLVAETLDLPFGALSCTAGMSEVHIFGRSVPDLKTGKSHFQSTAFLDCYENGGVFLFDEVDAADSNLMLAINSAISNGYANVPNREEKPRAEMHPDFVCMAAANTYGRGADRQYVGRNQLDASTLDRFAIGTIECDYDESVEAALCPDTELLRHLHAIRRAIAANGLRRFISTRFIESAYKMKAGHDWPIEKIDGQFFRGWSEDEKKRVLAAI